MRTKGCLILRITRVIDCYLSGSLNGVPFTDTTVRVHIDTELHEYPCVPFRASDDHTGHTAVVCAPYKAATTSNRENGE